MDRTTAGFSRRLAAGQQVSLFRDVLRQPIWVETLVTALLALAFERPHLAGAFNIAGEQVISREAFSRKLLDWWDIPDREAAVSISARSLPDPPPLDLRLGLEKAKAALGMRFEGVDEIIESQRR